MPEKTKPKENDEQKSAEDASEDKFKNSLDEDQSEKSYYYDDAHGYKIYDADEDEEEDDD